MTCGLRYRILLLTNIRPAQAGARRCFLSLCDQGTSKSLQVWQGGSGACCWQCRCALHGYKEPSLAPAVLHHPLLLVLVCYGICLQLP